MAFAFLALGLVQLGQHMGTSVSVAVADPAEIAPVVVVPLADLAAASSSPL